MNFRAGRRGAPPEPDASGVGRPDRSRRDDFGAGGRGAALRSYARARCGTPVVFAAGLATNWALALQVIPALEATGLLLLAGAAEAGERLTLRRLSRWPMRRRAGRGAWMIAEAVGALNALALAATLLLLSRLGGEPATPLVAAACLTLSVYVALVHGELCRLHLFRQLAILVAFMAPWASGLLTTGPGTGFLAAAMLAAILAVIYAHLDQQTLRRRRIQAELMRARKEAERRSEALERVRDSAERAALHDPLTGLPNRRYLEQRLAAVAARTDLPPPEERHLAVLVVDLDRFKSINDTLGHEAGDEVLRRMAGILQGCVREGDFVARVGGDEFVILAPCGPSRGAAEGVARRIIERAREPLAYGDQLCRFGATVGIAMAPQVGLDAGRLIAQADMALYRAKRRGRGRAEFFSERLQREAASGKRLADDILRGIEAGEFAPFYRPQLRAADLGVFGLEAVARWRHPVRGVLPPSAFLTAASEIGALAEIDRLILHRTLADREALAAQGLAPPRVSVNAGVARLTDPGLAADLARAGLPAGALAVELSDARGLHEEEEALRWAMERLAGLGVDVDLADFGEGPATVGTLTRLRPRRLKLDRRFAGEAPGSQERRGVLRAVVDLAEALGIGVIAEGVETPAQMALMRELGCEALQGFAIGAPMAADGLADWLRAAERAPLTPVGPACIRRASQ